MNKLTVFTTRSPIKYCTVITVGDRIRRIHFEPTVYFGRVGDSTYATASKAEIEALKAHPRFGEVFFLLSEESEHAPAQTKKPEIVAPKDIPAELFALLSDKENFVRENTVTNKPLAAAWLQDRYGAVFEATTAEDMRREAASKHGVIFINWQ